MVQAIEVKARLRIVKWSSHNKCCRCFYWTVILYHTLLQWLINFCVCTQLKNFRITRTQTADFFKRVIVLYFSFSSPFWSIQKLTKVIDNKQKNSKSSNKLTQLCCNISLTDIYQVCDNLFAPIRILQSVLPGLMDTEIVPDIIIHLEPFLYF